MLPYSGELRFAVRTAETVELSVVMVSSGGSSDGVLIAPAPGEWVDVSISLQELGGNTSFTGIWWQNWNDTSRPTVYFDNIRIVSDDSQPSPESGIVINVNTGTSSLTRVFTDPHTGAQRTHQIDFPNEIDENIYGINFAPNLLREELDVPVSRWGGNATERYNFQTSSSNQGNDWFYANNAGVADGHHIFESANESDGTQSLITLPALGWVSSGRTGTCSYPLSIAPNQDASINHWLSPNTACGNGYRDGQFLGTTDPSLTSVAADEQFAADWVREMVATHGSAEQGSVEMYAIGNEPGLWHYTHGDVRAEPLGRSEFIDMNLRYAKAIKDADPSAEVLGPVLWSGSSYYVSAEELLSGVRPADVPTFLSEYITAMRDAGAADGRRLLDRLAINFYDDRVYGSGTDTLRLESTRQLWDPTYAPADWWVVRDSLYGEGSAVIPRWKSLLAETYPNTPLAMTEYNFGGMDDSSGALAQIDALGIFGREGLDLATLWEPYADYVTTPEAEFSNRPIFWGMRLYRNYDGLGSKFGNLALHTTSSDEAVVSAFSAERDDGAITLILLNKSLREKNITLSGLQGDADAFRYLGTNPMEITQVDSVQLTDSIPLELPARSATLLTVSH